MNLQDFVSESLVEIANGVASAQKKIIKGALISPYIADYFDGTSHNPSFIGRDKSNNIVQIIEFDVAVTIGKDTETHGKISVVTGLLGLKSEGKTNKTDDSISRIRFVVPMSLPNEFKD